MKLISLDQDIELQYDNKDHVQYLKTTKGYSHDCSCSLLDYNITFNYLHYGT